MHLGQIRFKNSYTAAIVEEECARPIPGYTMLDLIRRSESENVALTALANRLAARHAEPLDLIVPIHPVEVWACGCTYDTSAQFRDSEHGQQEGIYAYVCREPRPEIFLKGTARVCVGTKAGIGLRADSQFTAPEPELALILGSKGRVLGYTIANDVSAWDIERENPLYLPQSKVYAASCALGPAIVTEDQVPDPYDLHMTCVVTRDGKETFSGEVSTGKLRRKFDELTSYLLRSNPVPAGSVLLTGTGIIVPRSAALQPGDVVTITVERLGELVNTAVIV
jgi:2-dehydro-3-deoxy-D-arabinonate dehydratase